MENLANSMLYTAVLSTPTPQVYTPIAPTFLLRGHVPARVTAGHAQIMFLGYQRRNDPDVTGVDLRCFLAN